MKLFATCIALAFTIQIQAAEIKLATITTDVLTDVTTFFVEINDDGSVQGLRYISTSESGQITEDVHNSINEVRDGGLVLEEMEGREIIRLFIDDTFSEATGGKLRLNFLASGVTGSHSNTFIKLVKTPTGFSLADMDGKLVNTLFVKGNWSRWLRRWVGVSSIKTSFSEKNQK